MLHGSEHARRFQAAQADLMITALHRVIEALARGWSAKILGMGSRPATMSRRGNERNNGQSVGSSLWLRAFVDSILARAHARCYDISLYDAASTGDTLCSSTDRLKRWTCVYP